MGLIVVTGRDDRVTSRHKQHAEEKIAKLRKYFNGIQRIEATLGFGSQGTRNAEAEAELVITVRGGKPIVCYSKGNELYAAVDLVLDKAEKQLTRHKEKLKTHKGGGHAAPAVDLDAVVPPSDEDEGYQDVVEKRDYP